MRESPSNKQKLVAYGTVKTVTNFPSNFWYFRLLESRVRFRHTLRFSHLRCLTIL